MLSHADANQIKAPAANSHSINKVGNDEWAHSSDRCFNTRELTHGLLRACLNQ